MNVQRRFGSAGKKWKHLFCPFIFLLAACQTPLEKGDGLSARQIALNKGWQEFNLTSSPYPLRAYLNHVNPSDGVLTIYIEGDGAAWVNHEYPSEDPTPKEPIALSLALAQPIGAVAYLARPCQFIGLDNKSLCSAAIWTSARYSEGVVQSSNQAIDLLKAKTKANKIALVGYSGGAAVALLVASRRGDIESIIAVAGNVNPHAWVKSLGMQALRGSLDPQGVIPKISHIRQFYFLGLKDQVLAPELSYDFIAQFPQDGRPQIVEVSESGHVCCWVQQWPALWRSTNEKGLIPKSPK